MAKNYTFPKRIRWMLYRSFIHVPRIFVQLLHSANSEKLSEDKKFRVIREIGVRGCDCGNVTVHGYGFDQLKDLSGYIMYPNHQGLFDVMGIVYHTPNPFGVVIKKEAYNIYLLRKLIQAMSGLFMDRDDPKEGLKTINQVAEQVKAGRNYLIFPEGTRSKQGNKVGEFKSGSFKAATKAKCPIVPIAIIDSFLPFDQQDLNQVDVQIHVLTPIPYEEYQGMKTGEIADMVKERIVKVIAEHEHDFNN